MKPFLPFALLALAAAGPAAAQENFSVMDLIKGRAATPAEPTGPKIEAKRIINESNSFLKEREPEMTGEEYALYEKVVTMLSTNVDFALTMLTAMQDEKEPPSPAFEFILGNVYYNANQLELAEKNYRSAVQRYPDFVRAWNNLGVLYYTSNRFAEAAPCFSKSVVLGDRAPLTFGLLGFCLEQQGDIISAEMAYLQALSGDPANSEWKEGLLRIYMDGKQWGRAEPFVKGLIKTQPAEKRFWLTYAGILLAQGKKIEATVLLETAVGAKVAGAEEFLLLGDLYAEQNLTVEALAVYQKALDPARDRGEQRLLRFAHALIAAGKLPEAERVLAALKADLTPAGQLAVRQARADLLVARKRWPEARAEAEALLKLAPLNGPALLTVGRTYAEEENFASAMLAFEAAYRVPESTYRASLELAGIELRNRRYDKSVAYLEKALSIQRTDAVEDYLARVKTFLARDANSG